MGLRLAVTGHKGCIGSKLVSLGAIPLVCDVTRKEEVEAELHRVAPDVIIHAAAISSADRCEEDYEKALQVNVRGTNIVCEAANNVLGEGRVVVMSSDQVFDGKRGKYKEDDEPNPIHAYGITKTFAEGVAQLYDCKVLRISRCFDGDSKDICEYLLRLHNNIEIEVPNFITRSYCHTDYMAESIWVYANRFFEMPEVLHIGGAYPVTFLHFIRQVADEYGYDQDLISPRGERPGYSPRPHKCGLDISLAVSLEIPIYTISRSIQRLRCETKITS